MSAHGEEADTDTARAVAHRDLLIARMAADLTTARAELAALRRESERHENELSMQAEAHARKLAALKASETWRIGRTVVWVPRTIVRTTRRLRARRRR